MNTSEINNNNALPETEMQDDVFNIDFISQMANAIYREGISDSGPQHSTLTTETNIPSEVNSLATNPEGINRKESPNQGNRLAPKMQQTRQPENHIYQPEPTSTSQPPRRLMPTDNDLYFLQPTQNPTTTSDQQFLQQPSGAIDPFNATSGSFMKPSFQTPSETQPTSKVDAPQTGLYFEDPFQNCFYFQQFLQPSPSGNNLKNESKQNSNSFAKTDEREFETNADWSDYRMFNPEYVRKDFPVLQQNVNGKPLVWLDNGATTQKPQSVIDALSDFYSNYNSNIHRGAHTLAARATDAYENTREKIRNLIGAQSKDEIIYVRGTTEGINLIANTFGRQRIGPGDEILISELEHHANIVPWQLLAKEKGAKLRMIPINDKGDIMLEAYERLFNQNTKLVAVGQVSNAIGTVLPVKKMIETAHRYGVPVVVDGAQSVQHMPVNVQELDADFFVFSGHKIFAPTGIGAVYGKKRHLEMMPPWQGGGNMIDQVTFEETTYNGVPAIFEAGTPSIGDAIGLGAAIDYVQKLGMENIHRYETGLMEYMVRKLQDIPGLNIIGNPTHRAGALSFVMDNIPTETMGQLLDKEGIAVRSGHHCAQPALRHFGQTSSVRPSLAFYNTKKDIDRLREAILKII